MFEGLRTSTELIVIVVTRLSFGCPVQAIVQAYGLDERTVASWRDRAGKQCQRVHRAIVEQGQVDLVHVQADEIRVKARGMVAPKRPRGRPRTRPLPDPNLPKRPRGRPRTILLSTFTV